MTHTLSDALSSPAPGPAARADGAPRGPRAVRRMRLAGPATRCPASRFRAVLTGWGAESKLGAKSVRRVSRAAKHIPEHASPGTVMSWNQSLDVAKETEIQLLWDPV